MLIYLSYTDEDYHHGCELYARLSTGSFCKQHGTTCWRMQDVYGEIQEVQAAMTGTLWQAAIFVPLLSPAYLADARCRAELQIALRLKREGVFALKRIVPVLLIDVDLDMRRHEVAMYRMYPRNEDGEPQALTTWGNRDLALQNVQQGIVRTINAIKDGK